MRHPSLVAVAALAALAALFAHSRTATAGTTATGFESTEVVSLSAMMPVGPAIGSPSGTLEVSAWRRRHPPATRYPAAPKYAKVKPPHEKNSLFQIHGGYYDPDGITENDFVGGIRIASGEGAQIGVNADWAYSTRTTNLDLGGAPLPGGGGTTQRNVVLTEVTSHLVPVMGFLQVAPKRSRGLLPYAGVGGGYEWFFIQGDDFTNGLTFDANYGGWGWQTWAGIGIPLGADTRLNAEYFHNWAEVGRDVFDPSLGVVYRETVNLEGGGVRAGLAWQF